MGAWIEILHKSVSVCIAMRRTPRWVRGLKSCLNPKDSLSSNVAPHDGCVDWNSEKIDKNQTVLMSHPTMGAWIEIGKSTSWKILNQSRTPRWVRGLKLPLRLDAVTT